MHEERFKSFSEVGRNELERGRANTYIRMTACESTICQTGASHLFVHVLFFAGARWGVEHVVPHNVTLLFFFF
jgi:hypothetical protein